MNEQVRLTEGERARIFAASMSDMIDSSQYVFAGITAAVEAILAARLAPIEALASEWEGRSKGFVGIYAECDRDAAEALRAALSTVPQREPTASQEQGGSQ